MAQPKGKTGNPNGRPKGAGGKITTDLRLRFKDFLDGNFHKVQDWFDRVATTDPAEAVKLYILFTHKIVGNAPQQVDITSNGKTIQTPMLILNGNPPTDQD